MIFPGISTASVSPTFAILELLLSTFSCFLSFHFLIRSEKSSDARSSNGIRFMVMEEESTKRITRMGDVTRNESILSRRPLFNRRTNAPKGTVPLEVRSCDHAFTNKIGTSLMIH